MKKAIIIIVSVLVIAGGAFAALYFFTDVFNFLKPASDNFSIQAKKLFGANEDGNYSEYEKFLNKLKSNSGSQTANVDLSMNMNLPSSVLDTSTQKLINSSKINLSASYDVDKKVTSATANIKYNNQDFISLDAVTKDQSVSIKSSDVYDKYLTFDLSKYEEFCQKNNIETDADTLEAIESLKKMNEMDTSNLIYDLFYISEKDYKNLNKTYGNLEDLIDKKAYTSKKNQKISVNGDEIKTTAYSLTLTGEDGYDFLTKFVDLMKNDSTLRSLIVSKYDVLKNYTNSIAEATGETSSELSNLSESDIKEYFEELSEALEDLEEDFADIEKCVKLTIYSEKDEPVKFEVIILDDEKDDEGSVIFTEELSDGKNIYTIDLEKIAKLLNSFSSSSSYDYSSYYGTTSSKSSISSIASAYSKIIISDEYEAGDDSRKGTVTISVKPSGDSKQDLLKIDYDTIDSESEFKCSMSVSLSSSLAAMASLSGVSGLNDATLNYTYHVTGLNSDTQNIKFSIDGKLSSYSIGLEASGTLSNKSEVPEMTSSNSVDVFSLSQEEFMNTYKDVVNSAADKLPAKLSTYGIDITKEDILKLLPVEEPVTTTEVPADTNTTTEVTPAA